MTNITPFHESVTSDGQRAVADGGLSVTDPSSVAERDGVAVETSSYDHDSADHCELDAAGRSVVGVTAGDRLLVLTHDAEPYVLLPNEVVEPGDDWAVTAREAVASVTGVPVRLDGVEVVREVEHTVAGDETGTTYHVLFAASVDRATVPTPETPKDDWTAEWLDELPAAVAAESGDGPADVRRFR